MKRLEVGQELDLKYYALDESNSNITKQLKTKIRHITKGKPGHFNGHYMVGVLFVE